MPVPKPSIAQITIPTSNYGDIRGNPTRITFHHIVGDAQAAISRFKDPSQKASATFVISSKGEIYQCVPLNRRPFSDGVTASNTATASIEHAGGHPSVPYSSAMYRASESLVAWLIQTYKITDFKRHRDLKATACPGDLDVERIIKNAKILIGDNMNATKAQMDYLFALYRKDIKLTGEQYANYSRGIEGLFEMAVDVAKSIRNQKNAEIVRLRGLLEGEAKPLPKGKYLVE